MVSSFFKKLFDVVSVSDFVSMLSDDSQFAIKGTMRLIEANDFILNNLWHAHVKLDINKKHNNYHQCTGSVQPRNIQKIILQRENTVPPQCLLL